MLKRWLRSWLGVEGLERWHQTQGGELHSEIRMLERRALELLEIQRRQIESLSAMGVDINMHEESLIVVVSKVGGGRIEIIPVNFKNLLDIENYVRAIKADKGIDRTVVDAAREMRGITSHW